MDTKEQEKISQLLEGAEKLFMKFGIRSMSMDEVARQLGVSKKTLYQFFSDKNDLVFQVIKRMSGRTNEICAGFNEHEDPIKALLDITVYVAKMQRSMNSSVIFDLMKYHPQAWQVIHEQRKKFVSEQIYQNLEQGKRLGLYDEKINSKLTSEIYVRLVESTMNPDTLVEERDDITKLKFEIIKYHIRSVSTEKGRNHFYQQLKEIQL